MAVATGSWDSFLRIWNQSQYFFYFNEEKKHRSALPHRRQQQKTGPLHFHPKSNTTTFSSLLLLLCLSHSHSLGWWTYFFVRLVLPILLVVLLSLFTSCSRLCCTPVVVHLFFSLLFTVVNQRRSHTYIYTRTQTYMYERWIQVFLSPVFRSVSSFESCFSASQTSDRCQQLGINQSIFVCPICMRLCASISSYRIVMDGNRVNIVLTPVFSFLFLLLCVYLLRANAVVLVVLISACIIVFSFFTTCLTAECSNAKIFLRFFSLLDLFVCVCVCFAE